MIKKSMAILLLIMMCISAPGVILVNASQNEMQTIRFGPYEWQVLDTNAAGQMLIITKDVIEEQPYNGDLAPVDWEGSGIHAWLNSAFLDEFSEEEKSRITEADISAYVGVRPTLWLSPVDSDAQQYDTSLDPEWYKMESRHFIVEGVRDCYTGNITPECLADFLDVLDQAYDAGVELIGRIPADGEKIILHDTYPDTDPIKTFAAGGNMIWLPSPSWDGFLKNFEKDRMIDFVMLHELGHIFTVEPHVLEIEKEVVAHFIGIFMASQLDVPFANIDARWDGSPFSDDSIVTSKQYAKNRLEYEVEWALNKPDVNNVLWLVLAPVLENYGYKPFMDIYRRFDQEDTELFAAEYYPTDAPVENPEYYGDKAVKIHTFLHALSYFTQGGPERVVPDEVMERINREWPVIERELMHFKDFEYYIEDGSDTAIIVKYSGTSADIIIPESIDGKTVTSVTSDAFKIDGGNPFITSIYISRGVSDIEERLFQFGSDNRLASITVDKDNQHYTSVDGVLFSKTMDALLAMPSSKEGIYHIPDSVSRIGTAAFMDSRLSEINMPSSITQIGDSAFEGAQKLSTIVIPSKTSSIGNRAFYWSSATTYYVPASVVQIGSDTFYTYQEVSLHGAEGSYAENYAVENGLIFKVAYAQIQEIQRCTAVYNIRSVPVDGTVITKTVPGREYQVVEVNPDNEWVHIVIDGAGSTGWVSNKAFK